ncbi:MAG TPA: AAA family ATPase [Actinomycetota bacterium]|nr:AAA family ATPase [Actinomycetota bacterium]
MRTCPECGFENGKQARFCGGCGTRLEEERVGRKERKFATALFADVVGSTELGEREDPEVVAAVVSRTFERLAAEVERYGGVVEKFIGDAIFALFGVPVAHEDDPDRAVRAGLEMQAALAELNRDFAAEGKPELALRTGIEAGEVLVDLDRVAGARDRMITGDAVNLAARLQAASEPNSVVVGPAVYASTKEVVEYRELPALPLKGKSGMTPAWCAVRVMARRHGERPPLGLEARLVGRDEELRLLKHTLERVESEDRAALVTVLGPAGVGKSRLAWEFMNYVDGLPQSVYWRKGRCSSYGNVSYSALAEAIKVQCGIKEDDSPQEASRKVGVAVRELFDDDALVPHIEVLTGVRPDHRYPREELFDAWRRFLERMAGRFPLVLFFEDVHWADEGLLAFIDHLADFARGPIFVLTLARPELLELRPTWGGGKRNYAAVYLDPLSPDENALMLFDLVEAKLPDDLTRVVVARAEGNPLFTEEIVRMFVDRGILRAGHDRWEVAREVDEIEIPRSIHALIAARLDSLPGEEKEVLQDAAVVGRIFWDGAVETLAATDPRPVLTRLRVKELVVPREPSAFSDDHEYSFRHVLIRDVAYDALPKAARAAKHAAIASWAEERAGERREEVAELIATHLKEAVAYARELGDPAHLLSSAYRWARAAGDRARRLWQGSAAADWYRVAIDLAVELGCDEEEQAELWERLGFVVLGLENLSAGVEALEQAAALFELSGRVGDAARCEVQVAWSTFLLGSDAGFRPRIDRVLERLEPLGDSEVVADALAWRGWYEWRLGNFSAEEDLRRAIDMAERLGADVTRGMALTSLGAVMIATGRWQQGQRTTELAWELGCSTRNLTLFLRSANNFAAALIEHSADYDRAAEVALDALETAHRTGRRDLEAWLLSTLGEIDLDRGNLDGAEEYFRRGLEAGREIGDQRGYADRLMLLADVRSQRGDLDAAEALLEEAREIFARNPEPRFEMWIEIIGARVAAARGDPERALALLQRGLNVIPSDSTEFGLHILLLEVVRRLVHLGRSEEARAFEKRLDGLVGGRRNIEAFALNATGLLDDDPVILERAAEIFDELGQRINRARCLVDLGMVRGRIDGDPIPALEEALGIFRSCGAFLYVTETEDAIRARAVAPRMDGRPHEERSGNT